MTLSEFIREQSARIIDASIAFARTIPNLASPRLDVEVLRDHLPNILETIAADLESPQTRAEGIAKAEGRGPAPATETPAQSHGRARADGGLSVDQLVSEYRVLRASVGRLWVDSHPALDAAAAAELVRFHEAIDQAIAESIDFHSKEVDRWRAMLLAVVGHDLREPLNTIMMTTDVLSGSVAGGPHAQAVSILKRGSERLRALLDSLLEYSNARLGSQIPLRRSEVDLDLACRREIDLLRSAFPTAVLEVKAHGSLKGWFDESRVRQALSNLVSNAVQYRTPDTPIEVDLAGDANAVTIVVRNEAPAIEQQVLDSLFEPLRRRDSTHGGQRRNFGLGLFIVKEIALAHGGTADAESKDGKVAFCFTLPRAKDPQAPTPAIER